MRKRAFTRKTRL